MTEVVTQTAATPATPKVLTVLKDMPSRSVFATVEDAFAFMQGQSEKLSDFATTPSVFSGVSFNDEGEAEIDPEVYTDSMEVVVSKLTEKGSKEKGTEGKVKAIVMYAAPTFATLSTREDGMAWLQEIIRKELNLVAVRQLRMVANPALAADKIPTTVSGYIEGTRESAGIMEAYDELYQTIIKQMSKKLPVFARQRFNKAEFRKALESKAYALEIYNAVEDRGDSPSLLVVCLNIMASMAVHAKLDGSIFAKWLASRDEKTIDINDSDDDAFGDDFDADSLAELMLKADAPKPVPATDTAAVA